MKIKIYKPRVSRGWIYNGIINLTLLLIIIHVIFNIILKEKEIIKGIIIFIFPIFLLIGFIVISSIFLVWYPTMRYELSEDKLVLKCGPLESEIPLESIKAIRKKNLKYHPSSTGWKLPGYCLFRIKYADEDWVRMYSRAMLKNIIIIETDKEKYGITPKDEEDFLGELSKRTGVIPEIEVNRK